MTASASSVRAGNLGFPRIGLHRELKFALEAWWAGKSTAEDLENTASDLRQRHWRLQAAAGLDFIPSNDFSLYDHVLDAAALVGAVPPRYPREGGAGSLATYFAMARGTAKAPAMEMTKWFDTNYHYIVPELDANATLGLSTDKPLRELLEARRLGIQTRPVLLGPVSLVLLSKVKGGASDRAALVMRIADVYRRLLIVLASGGAKWVQLDEPCLGLDLSPDERDLYARAYAQLGDAVQLFVATYFSDLRDNLDVALGLPISALHLDLVRAPSQLARALDAVPGDLSLSLGVVNGRGIWRTDLDRALDMVRTAVDRLGAERVQVAPSCSLLHVPVDSEQERDLDPGLRGRLAFATQKLDEVALLARAASDDSPEVRERLAEHRRLLHGDGASTSTGDAAVQRRAASVNETMLSRHSTFDVRKRAQAKSVPLPQLPTTTIGSLPQTPELRRARAAARKGDLSVTDYEEFLRGQIALGIHFQEDVGLDVLVHGESERNDMVEYFASKLDGFAFTRNGWVQSYGSRCVKPPLIHGDVARPAPMTVRWSSYAQSLTAKPVKGMLTGPVTMLQWSFLREDVPASVIAVQLALALRDEITDLERAGIRVIQVDEPALREGLPLHRAERAAYLEWAVDAFRLATAGVNDSTQIHTHMCYADFGDILPAVGRMDADVISLEAARSGMELVRSFNGSRYANDIGPGVYDIHSPRVPTTGEMADNLRRALETFAAEQLWVNPDCGLKTRSWDEVRPALTNMVAAAQVVRAELQSRDASVEPAADVSGFGGFANV